MVWTLFWDMHSGGGPKEAPYSKIYIEAPKEDAKVIFFNRFGHSSSRVSCTCCGEDYVIDVRDTLENSSAFHRNCEYVYRDSKGKVVDRSEGWETPRGIRPGYTAGYEETEDSTPLEDYIKQEDVLVIRAEEIKDEERRGEVPESGYAWVV